MCNSDTPKLLRLPTIARKSIYLPFVCLSPFISMFDLFWLHRAVFIADQRFLALKQPNKFWTLQIKYVQARDAGAYECQVSAEPKISARVHLQVIGKFRAVTQLLTHHHRTTLLIYSF